MFESLSDRLADIIPWAVVVVAILLFLFLRGYRILGVVMVPNNRIGVVNKKFVLVGRGRLPDGHILALKGEAGSQADTLAPGVHYLYWPWQYAVEIVPFVTIDQMKVGLVEAIDGLPMPMGRVLAPSVECDRYQDARAFLADGGYRGPQMDVIPPGTYRINPVLFKVTIVDALVIPAGKVGVVTVMEGAPLPSGEIAGQEVAGHNSFQDTDAFVRGGGQKGVQEQVMLAGTYYINRLFMSVEGIDLTDVPIGYAGVVVSYVGKAGGTAADVSGKEFTHGNIVPQGCKGVWSEPLDPGRYPINRRTHYIEAVPTTNIVLNWATGKIEAHQLDKNLSTITVRSGDGFTFNLEVSQIIHVSRENAPKVIARFGSMANLVTQVLEPIIGNYFRNSAQASDVIDFLRSRSDRQNEASKFIADALDKYNVQAVDTLIGDITPPPELMKTLTDRKVAEQSKMTYRIETEAQQQRQQLAQATAEADTRGQVVQASRTAEVAKLTAEATVSKAKGDADARKLAAEGEASYVRLTGEADATKTTAVGQAEAGVLKSKVDAVGADKYALMNVIERVAQAKIALVPQIVAGGDTNGANRSNLVDALLGNLIAKQLNGEQKHGS